MRIFIITDIEGTSGVWRWEQGDRNSPWYLQAVRLATAELLACLDGIREVAADAHICIWDAHGSGSIDFEQVPSGCELLNAVSVPLPELFGEGWDALFFVGQHSKAGTARGVLAHTYSSSTIERFAINGLEMGEFGCRAALAGSYDIPTAFISGDEAAVAEARALVPNIYGAPVKVGLGPQLARHLAPPDACALIRENAAAATRGYGSVSPMRLGEGPYTQEIRVSLKMEPVHLLGRSFTQLDLQNYVKTSDSLADLWI
ncbi:MAG: M55 family metallopeptidase [Chloroflexi bacterium]|nr:M55 family metallopeptidase [Chloroflexota bacterium]